MLAILSGLIIYHYEALLDGCFLLAVFMPMVVATGGNTGAQAATIYYGYGTGIREQLGLLGLAVDVEKEIIITLVGDNQLDRIFERMYFAAELDMPAAGIIYVTKLEKAATYIPKEVIERITKESSS